ncbi:aminotransferase class IV [Luteimonas sp. 3794]|uniref:aminotransferase class IV n=1 Tax=Luteimonas sp. 3794 TaxID=2817730 RepID=UPI002858FEBC|nr:aminotransferase class IV [Luteimonas sp. 3794]MDR6992652.1 branched-subunit amino acid aminotransferase/4-amino-4-deoxychorismate lyase [Luteimonas sp. 3794]
MNRIASATSLWIDGRPADTATLSALQTNYGHLSTMQVRGGAVQGFGHHLARLQSANTELFGGALPAARIRNELASALRAAQIDDATLRVSVGALDIAAVERGDSAEVVLLVALSPPRTAPTAPQRLQSCRHQRPLAHLKHLATLPLLRARRTARAAGFDDALLVDDAGYVLEGALWNIGFVDAEGGVIWPDGDALRGVTEGLLRTGLEAAGMSQRIERIRLVDCAGVGAAFACNSSGLWPLGSIDGRSFTGEPRVPGALEAILAAVPWDPLWP